MNGWRILRGESSLASFLSCIEESISEREGKQFEEVELRGICMGFVMQELDYCLRLGQEHMV